MAAVPAFAHHSFAAEYDGSKAVTLKGKVTRVEWIGYEATIDDVKVFTRPWKKAFALNRNTQGDYEQMEYACIEGEKDLQHYTASEGGKK